MINTPAPLDSQIVISHSFWRFLLHCLTRSSLLLFLTSLLCYIVQLSGAKPETASQAQILSHLWLSPSTLWQNAEQTQHIRGKIYFGLDLPSWHFNFDPEVVNLSCWVTSGEGACYFTDDESNRERWRMRITKGPSITIFRQWPTPQTKPCTQITYSAITL